MKEAVKTEEDFRLFSNLFLFRGCAGEAARLLFTDASCRCISFEAEESVYSRRNFQKSLGLVLSGEARAYKQTSEGTLLLNTFFAGNLFGAAGLFTDAEEYVSEIMAEKSSRLLFLPQELLRQAWARDVKIAENYIAYLSGRICFLNSRIDLFTAGSAENRLAAFLSSYSENSGGTSRLRLPFSFVELSNRLNMGRASLYRAFDTLEGQGILRREGKDICLLRPQEK